MSDQNAARALYQALMGKVIPEAAWQVDIVQEKLYLIDAALRAERAKVWEEAAKLCDERYAFYFYTEDVDKFTRRIQQNEAQGCAAKIRQEAREEAR